MNYQIINAIFFGVLLLLLLSIIKNIFEVGEIAKEKKHNEDRLKRIQELQQTKKKTTKDSIDEYTKPFIQKYFPRLSNTLPSLRIENLMQVEEDLLLTGWDDMFTPQTYVATSLILKILSLGFLVLTFMLGGVKKVIGIAWFLALFFVLDMLFKSAIQSKKDELFNGFPEFIRITTSFLSADMPFVDSVENASNYVNDAWKPILKKFVHEADSLGVDQALVSLRDSVDLFEVKEFVGLVRLTLEQGGNAKEGFSEQADKISEMKKSRLIKLISTRKIYVTILDFPLLMASMTVIALPTLSNISLFLNL